MFPQLDASMFLVGGSGQSSGNSLEQRPGIKAADPAGPRRLVGWFVLGKMPASHALHGASHEKAFRVGRTAPRGWAMSRFRANRRAKEGMLERWMIE